MAVKEFASSHAKLVAGDIMQMIKTERSVQIMLGILVVSLVCWQMPYVNWALYPFKLFVTIMQLGCQALATRVTGGTPGFLVITPDLQSGTLPTGGMPALILSAGYIGCSLVGAALIWFGRKPSEAKGILQALGAATLVLTVFYAGGGYFSFGAMLVTGLLLIAISNKGSEMFCHMLLLMLSVQTALKPVLESVAMIWYSLNPDIVSTAKQMETVTGVPAIVWSVTWSLASLVILSGAFWITYKPSKDQAGTAEAAQAAQPSITPPATPAPTTSEPASSPPAVSTSETESVWESDSKPDEQIKVSQEADSLPDKTS